MQRKREDPRAIEERLEELLTEDLSTAIMREQSTFDRFAQPHGELLVIFGAGNLGRKILAGLRAHGIKPLAFTDNNKQLWDTTVDGLIVLSPEEASHRYGREAVFITAIWSSTARDRQASRRQQLLALGCQKVVPFGYLFWKYPDDFLPHVSLDAPHRILQHADELRAVFKLWADSSSQKEYLAQLKFRLRMDFDGLPSPVDHKQYFPDDLYTILPGEVFVDCGAFDGDTIRDLLQRQENIGEILAFEPDPINFGKLKNYVSSLNTSIQEKIILRQAAIGLCNKKVRFSTTGTISSRVAESGDLELNCVCLDEQINNCSPTLIKMDIEGSEMDALNGGAQVIRKTLPILAVCVYHLPDHLWKIPLMIKKLSDDYRFFLRPHDEEGWELVCYAVPIHRLKSGK